MLLPKCVLDDLYYYKVDMGRFSTKKDFSTICEDTIVLIFKREIQKSWWGLRRTVHRRETITMLRTTRRDENNKILYSEHQEFLELRQQLHDWSKNGGPPKPPNGKEPIPVVTNNQKTKVIPFRPTGTN